MQEELRKAMDLVLSYIQQGAEFVSSQAPLIAQEYLAYNRAVDIAWIVIDCLGLVLVAVSLCKIHNKFKERDEWSDDAMLSVWCAVSIVLGFVLVFGLLATVFDLTKIIYAPRLYLLEGIKTIL